MASDAQNAANIITAEAGKAARLQQKVSTDALKLLSMLWGQQQQRMAPWLNLGGAAASRLGYLMGLTPPSGRQDWQMVEAPVGPGERRLIVPGTTAGEWSGSPFATDYGFGPGGEASPRSPTSGTLVGTAMPRFPESLTTGQITTGQPDLEASRRDTVDPNVPRVSPYATSRTVLLQAPDGTTQAVPTEQVQHFVSRGARVLA